VLGATNQVIINLLGKDMYLILSLASVIGLVAGGYLTNLIFDLIYAYHIDITIVHFVIPLLVICAIVLCAVGFKVIQTGRLNPTVQLRTE
jgi:ABC-type antimicrobial peptide transport system permease subunit